MFLITKILELAYVQNYMRCLSQNKSDTNDLYYWDVLTREYAYTQNYRELYE